MSTIKYNSVRYKDGKQYPTSREITPATAFYTIVRNEMGFSAKYLTIEDTELTVETQIFGDVDVTTVEGSAEELAPLIRLARLHCQYDPSRAARLDVIRARDPEFEEAANTLYSNIRNGTGTARAVLIALLHEDFGIPLDTLGTLNLDDLVAGGQLGWYEGATQEDMVALVG